VKLLVTVFAGAAVFAVIVGAIRPAKARVITAARTIVVFMGSPRCISKLVREILGLPDGYNLRGTTYLSPLDSA
jgi:hypothetical protein